jgi:large subunit ribosomal protein L22
MEIQAKARFVRLSPSKARDLARAIQGRPLPEALRIVQLSERKAAFWLNKTLKSAIANAENNAKLSAEKLYVGKAVVEKGPTMRRFWPRSRGMVSPIEKKTSHVKIVLTDAKPKAK